jgi:hypothetical protein
MYQREDQMAYYQGQAVIVTSRGHENSRIRLEGARNSILVPTKHLEPFADDILSEQIDVDTRNIVFM